MSEEQQRGEPQVDEPRPGQDRAIPERGATGASAAEQAIANEREALETGQESPG